MRTQSIVWLIKAISVPHRLPGRDHIALPAKCNDTYNSPTLKLATEAIIRVLMALLKQREPLDRERSELRLTLRGERVEAQQ